MKNSIPYWVGRAELAALQIESSSELIGKNYHGNKVNLDQAKAAHKEAMENLMRIAQHSYYIDRVTSRIG